MLSLLLPILPSFLVIAPPWFSIPIPPRPTSQFPTPLPDCANCLLDAALPGNSLTASSVPVLGALYPLSTHLFVSPLGNVGIGTTNPNRELEVAGGITANPYQVGTNFRLRENATNWGPNTSELYFAPTTGLTGRLVLFGNSSSKMDLLVSDGRIGVKTTSPDADLDVNGEIATDTLLIRGGGDLAERFDASGTSLEPGSVVALDPAHDGNVILAREPYDKKVIGVVSGASGIHSGLVLTQDDVLDGDVEVAMVGRVYVRCSAENGPIRPGDRLTTASLPGHAMKVTDCRLADGAVIGKAAGSLSEGVGLVLVVVNLQ